MCRQPRWRQLPCGLSEHGLDPLHRLGGHAGGGGAALHHLVGRLQGGGQVHQSLDLDPVPGSHVCDVVEVRRSTYHLGPAVRISERENGKYFIMRVPGRHSCKVSTAELLAGVWCMKTLREKTNNYCTAL